MPQIDPMRLAADLAVAYLWMLLILAVGCVVAVAIVSLWRERPGTDRDPLSR